LVILATRDTQSQTQAFGSGSSHRVVKRSCFYRLHPSPSPLVASGSLIWTFVYTAPARSKLARAIWAGLQGGTFVPMNEPRLVAANPIPNRFLRSFGRSQHGWRTRPCRSYAKSKEVPGLLWASLDSLQLTPFGTGWHDDRSTCLVCLTRSPRDNGGNSVGRSRKDECSSVMWPLVSSNKSTNSSCVVSVFNQQASQLPRFLGSASPEQQQQGQCVKG